jgi:hypothetical protein
MEEHRDPTSWALLWALRGLALALIALHLATPWFTESMAWGLWPITYLPAGWRWALSLLALAAVLGGDRLPTGLLRCPSAASPLIGWGLALASAIPFYFLRIRHLRWGDARLLVEAIPHPDFRLTYVWQAPLDVFVHAKAWALGNRAFGWADPRPVYWILSTAAGVVFVRTLWGLAGWLGRDRLERGLLLGLVLSLGTIQLFFGYIENYSLMTVGVLAYAWLAMRTLQGKMALRWPALALALTHAFHPSTLILVPSLLYAGWIGWRQERGASSNASSAFWRRLAEIAVPYTLVFVAVLALMTAGGHGLDALLGVDFPGGGDRRWFVPLFETTTRFERYTMFSLGHLVDVLNQQLLVAPVVWPALLLGALLSWGRLPRHDPLFRFLLAMAGCYLLLTLTWNPDYGGQRDWDLFAPAAVPAALLLAYTLPRLLPERAALRGAGWALVAAQVLHTLAWIYRNTLPA